MSRRVLVVATVSNAEECVRLVQASVGVEVELAPNKKAGLSSLRREDFAVIVVEESLAETDPQWAEEMREAGGLAMPLEVNFAITSSARLSREVKAALLRGNREQMAARRRAKADLENELKSSVTGLLLESELALREPTVSPTLEPKLRHLVELAGAIRERLRGEVEQGIKV